MQHEYKEKPIAMISQPMNGKSIPEIVAARNRATAILVARGYEVMDTWFKEEFESKEYSDSLTKDGVQFIPVYFLSKSIQAMSKVDLVFFCSGWQTARGCKIEQEIAEAYGLETMYE